MSRPRALGLVADRASPQTYLTGISKATQSEFDHWRDPAQLTFLINAYNDPRIHFVMNCASIGCPALRHQADVADRLNGPLEDATQKFLPDRTRNRIESDTLKVSGISNWYGQDFKNGWRGANTLGQFLAVCSVPLGLNADTSSRLSAGKLGIELLDYDWRLNAAGGSDRSGKS